MIVGGYTLDLYCDSGVARPYGTLGHSGPDGGGKSFTGHTRAECVRKAVRAGWRVSAKYNTCLCPLCAKGFRAMPTTPYNGE